MSAVIYTRVSDDRQVDGTSLETQQELCRAWCATHGTPVDRVFVEPGASAKTANRPQFQAALKFAVASHAAYFLVYKYNRFARNQEDHAVSAALLRKHGVQLVSVTEGVDTTNAGGRMIEGIFSIFNEFENAIRSENSMRGMKKRVSQGKWMWVAPLGYKNGASGEPSLVPDAEKAPLMARLFELVASGRYSDAGAAREVSTLGLRARGGGVVKPETLRGLFANPLYYGRIILPEWGVDIQGDFSPLIDKALFDRVQNVRADRAPKAVPRFRNNIRFPCAALCVVASAGIL